MEGVAMEEGMAAAERAGDSVGGGRAAAMAVAEKVVDLEGGAMEAGLAAAERAGTWRWW